MKNLFEKRKVLFGTLTLLSALAFEGQSAYAQVKIGDNPQTINAGSALEIEANAKGLLLPRVSLFKTDVWGLDGTPVVGMQVYNTNGNIFATDSHPIIQQGSGVYYWDGNGWVGTKAVPASGGDFDWLLTDGATNPSDPADIGKEIFHGGTGPQVVKINSTNAVSTKLKVVNGNGSGAFPVGSLEAVGGGVAVPGAVEVGSGNGHPVIFRLGASEDPNSEVMRITDSPFNHSVGIGTSTPSANLHVVGNLIVSDAKQESLGDESVRLGNGGLTLTQRNTQGGTFGGNITFKNDYNDLFDFNIWHRPNIGPAGALVIAANPIGQGIENAISALSILKNNGNVGIGKLVPAVKLDVVGEINATGVVKSAGVELTSDERLKKNILPVENALGIVSKLKPVSYRKKESIKSTSYDRAEIGFIAQEVRKILPQLVSEGKDADKTLALDYNSLIPVLTKAIQEQQEEIKALKAQNQHLTGQIATLDQSAKAVSALSVELNEIKRLLSGAKKMSSNEISK